MSLSTSQASRLAPAGVHVPEATHVQVMGWGRYPRLDATTLSFDALEVLRRHLERSASVIAHGLGRSYGDSALNETVVLTRRWNSVLDFDPATGTLTCESGLTLAEIIEAFLPQGWFLPVTPGTKFVTVGGAIAADVHGKNHHKVGAFSRFVDAMDLMLADGSVWRCTRSENRELFLATCGGMGLTGVILSATLRLRPVRSAFIRRGAIRARNLREILALFEEHSAATYSVAWIDALARGDELGRSVLLLGEHADDGGLESSAGREIVLPVDLPGFAINRRSIGLFNRMYERAATRGPVERVVRLDPFFYPLDAVRGWNRAFGRRGFLQYQFVLPKEAGPKALATILDRIASAGPVATLAVLKLFGAANDNLLSFPCEGYTLAVDFPVERRIFPLLDDLDRLVVDHGGRVYLAKDARMAPDTFRRGYPAWERFATLRESLGLREKFSSLQARRLDL